MVTKAGSLIGKASALQTESSRFEPCPAYIKEIDKELIKIWLAKGITYAEIGVRLNRSTFYVWQNAKKLGITSKRSNRKWDKEQIKKWIEEGITYIEISKRLKTSRQRIHQIAKELGMKSKRSPKNYDEKILKNYGWENINKLAEIYNVNNQNIYYQLHKHKIKKRSIQ